MKSTLAALAASLALPGCGLAPPVLQDVASQDPPGSIEIHETPFFPQEIHQCGPAALATVLVKAGKQVTPEDLAEQVYLPGRKGSLQLELQGAVRRQGLVPYPLGSGLPALIAELRAGRPVLVLMDLGIPLYPIWHYAVVIGHEGGAGSVILRSGSTRRKVMSKRRFLDAWEGADSWGLVVLQPGELPAQLERSRYLDAVAALEAVGEHGAAEAAYRAALGPWPDDPAVLLGIGNSRYGLGDLDGAQSTLRALIRKHPGSIPAYNNLAQVLAEQGQPRRALDMVTRGLTMTPQTHPLRQALEATQAEIQRELKRATLGRS